MLGLSSSLQLGLRLCLCLYLCTLLPPCLAHPGLAPRNATTSSTASLVPTPLPSAPAVAYPPYTLPRLVLYFQSAHSANGTPVSLLPLVAEKGIALTHLIVSAFHISKDRDLVLNDWAPADPRFATLWAEAAILQRAGVRVMAMLGGAAAGAFAADTLDAPDAATFEHYYAQLHALIVQHRLQGVDLDVEQTMSQAGIARLVRRLALDFRAGGADFEITLAPVGAALLPVGPGGSGDGAGNNLSGFRYSDLERALGRDIAFYNAQLYNGWGSADSPRFYRAMLGNGSGLDPQAPWVPEKVLLGEVTSPDNGAGYVAPQVLNTTVVSLRETYGPGHVLGGIMGWEYFNSQPGGSAEPWVWAQDMTAILRPGLTPDLRLTRGDARRLTAAYTHSVGAARRRSTRALPHYPSIDYYKMVA